MWHECPRGAVADAAGAGLRAPPPEVGLAARRSATFCRFCGPARCHSGLRCRPTEHDAPPPAEQGLFRGRAVAGHPRRACGRCRERSGRRPARGVQRGGAATRGGWRRRRQRRACRARLPGRRHGPGFPARARSSRRRARGGSWAHCGRLCSHAGGPGGAGGGTRARRVGHQETQAAQRGGLPARCGARRQPAALSRAGRGGRRGGARGGRGGRGAAACGRGAGGNRVPCAAARRPHHRCVPFCGAARSSTCLAVRSLTPRVSMCAARIPTHPCGRSWGPQATWCARPRPSAAAAARSA